jgi:hypothetical protein
MKRSFLRTCLGIVLVGLAAPRGIGAQGFAEEPPLSPPPGEMPPPESLDAPEPAGPPPGPEAPPVDIWMDRLHRRNPDEFRHFQRMRHQDPEGFRKELATRLGRERLEAGMAAHPRLRAFLETLPESERMEVILALSRVLRPEGPPPSRESAGPETQSLREDISRLAGEYRKTDDPEQRERLQAELRVKLGEMFDAREQDRAQHIERIQAEIAKLQQLLESRRARREEIIDRRLHELTDDENLKW